jgi:SAM-dependent methyltransferase
MEPHEYARMFALEESYWWYRALRRYIRQALVRSGAFPRTPSATSPAGLDAGCGTGMLLATWGDRVHGVGLDFSATALAGARRRGLGRLMQASVEAIPLRSGAMDFIVSADVLYHRGVRDDLAALREFQRCLRPGGVLVLNLPAYRWLRSAHDDAIHTERRYTAGEVRAKLRRAGLRPVRVRYWNWLCFPPIALVRLVRRRSRSGTGAPSSDLTPLPRGLNALLDALLALEARLAFLPAPAGLSVLAVARKE